MSYATLAEERNTAAASALVAYVTTKEPRRRKRDGAASILDKDQNADLDADIIDLIADVLIWAKAKGLDTAMIARCAMSHTGADALADDRAAHGAAPIPARNAVVEIADTFGNLYIVMASPRGGWSLVSANSGTPQSFGNLFDRGGMVEAMLEQCTTADEVLELITANASRFLSGPKQGQFTGGFAPRLVTR